MLFLSCTIGEKDAWNGLNDQLGFYNLSGPYDDGATCTAENDILEADFVYYGYLDECGR